MAGTPQHLDAVLRFAVLGPLEVTRSGVRLPLGGRQQRAVLALLLAESGTVVSVGRLGDALWGEQTPSGFVTTIQTYVFHLREVLEPDRPHGARGRVLVSEHGGYRLELAGGVVDSAVFEGGVRAARQALDRHAYEEASDGLGRALGLWRGDVLADVADLGFVKPIAARLETMRMIAQGLRIEAELALGRHAAALPEIDRLVAEHPLQENLHEQRMTALYRLGRQSDALAAYREVRTRLNDELGIEPSPHLRKLHQSVLAQDPALDWQPQGAGGSPLPAPGQRSPAVETAVESAVEPAVETPRSPAGPASSASPAGPLPQPPSPARSRPVGHWLQIGSAAAAVLLTGVLLTVLATQWASPGPRLFAANSVGSLSDDGSLGESLRVGLSPDGLAYGAGALWAANRADGTVSRIDPKTRAVVQTIVVGSQPTALTVAAGDLWVVNFGDGTVSRVNTVTSTVVDRIAVGNQPVAIDGGRSGVWVANSGDDSIQRIDPITGRADRAVKVGDYPDGIAVDATDIWVCHGIDGTVSQINPVTLQPGKSVLVGGGPRGIALTRSDVWVASRLSQSVTRINRTSGAVRTISVGDGPNSVEVVGRAVWVSNEYDGSVARIDPLSNEVRKVFVGASPRGLAEAGGSIWVASGAFADLAHAGGTLRVVGDTIPGEQGVTDPAAARDRRTTSAERFVYDGLVALGMSGGASSQSILPDLAVALPRPSNGNRTYAFTLRPGIRYSTGREVRAADFRTGVLKALTVGGNREALAGLVGGRSCVDHPASCDLSEGLVTDDASRGVTFNLVAPDPQFLDKLTGFVYPVPPGTATGVSRTPVPGTGPYLIAAHVPNKQFTLRRNPHFRQWSFAAQPAGYPDVIDFHRLPDGRAAAGEVIAGRADVAGLSASTKEFRDDLARRHPAQLKLQPLAQTDFEYLNTRLAPFDDVRVRRALNYAVDRRRVVDILGDAAEFSVTCQILPPNFPSHAWYCPYTGGKPDGRYHGPNLGQANELVRLSGTRGMAVTIQGVAGGVEHELNAYFATVLRRLGYEVRLRELPSADYDPVQSRKEAHVSSGPGWVADFSVGASFVDSFPGCSSSVGIAGPYCRPEVQRAVAQAREAELTDPGQASRRWTEVDRLITDDAPVVPLGNLTESVLVSPRVGNYHGNPTLGPVLSQLWVK